MISIIIPTYNEQEVIEDCMQSLLKQTFKDSEIIIVDDGSTDLTLEVLSKFKDEKLKILKQKHQGPGLARNLGAKFAKGEILVFVDADMIFDTSFIEKLTKPIREKKAIGTFSKEEYVLNKENIWSKCWNINRGSPIHKMHPENYPDTQPVFRAILKKEFDRSGGFEPIGYIDDYTISGKLGIQATAAKGAKFYHRNPETLKEVFNQARWVGKSEYKKRKIKNEFLMRVISIIRYSLLLTLFNGLFKAIKFGIPEFLIFKVVYDLAVETSLFRSFLGEQQYK